MLSWLLHEKLPQLEYKVYETNKQTCIWCFWNSNKEIEKSLYVATLLNYFTPIGMSILGTALCNLSWSLYCWIAVGGGNFARFLQILNKRFLRYFSFFSFFSFSGVGNFLLNLCRYWASVLRDNCPFSPFTPCSRNQSPTFWSIKLQMIEREAKTFLLFIIFSVLKYPKL